jgi:hypothetical protein
VRRRELGGLHSSHSGQYFGFYTKMVIMDQKEPRDGGCAFFNSKLSIFIGVVFLLVVTRELADIV